MLERTQEGMTVIILLIIIKAETTKIGANQWEKKNEEAPSFGEPYVLQILIMCHCFTKKKYYIIAYYIYAIYFASRL